MGSLGQVLEGLKMVKKGKLKIKDVDEIIMEIKGAIENSPKKSKKLLYKTLLNNFGFKAKSKERSEFLMDKFNKVGIFVSPSLLEGNRDEWITLSITEPNVPITTIEENKEKFISANFDENIQSKLDEITSKDFNTEKEVEIKFILPLISLLGYNEEDRADGYPVSIYTGVKKSVKEADFVLFNGKNRAADNALLVIEAKSIGKKLDKHIYQARSYAMWLGTPYYLVTNGDEIKVFLFRSAISTDIEVFNAKRNDLKNLFNELYKFVSKQAIIEYKKQKK